MCLYVWQLRQKKIHTNINYIYAFLVIFNNCKDFLVIDRYGLNFFYLWCLWQPYVNWIFSLHGIFQLRCIFGAAVLWSWRETEKEREKKEREYFSLPKLVLSFLNACIANVPYLITWCPLSVCHCITFFPLFNIMEM